jgi:hypothetical protein
MRFHSFSGAALAVVLSLALGACGGGSGGGAPAPLSDTDAAAVNLAVASGNARAVSLSSVLAATRNLLTAQASAYSSSKQTLFGLNADGTANAGSLTGIDWDPSHDSSYFAVQDSSRNRVVLPGNWRYSDGTVGTGTALAVVGEAPTTLARYAAFGGNPMGERGNAAMDMFLKNTISWLTGRSTFAGFKVVTAHLPSDTSYWFKHEKKVNAWINTQYPGVAINGKTGAAGTAVETQEDACDGSQLAACLQGAHLLVVGREQGPGAGRNSASPDNYPSGYNSDTVMSAVLAAQAQGIPVLYLHHYRDANDLATRMQDYLGLANNNNYWAQEGVQAFNPATLPAAPAMSADMGALLQRLDTGSFTSTWSGCFNDLGRMLCENTSSTTYDSALSNEFAVPGKAIRSNLRALDAKGFALFSQSGYALEKLLVLLGDKYREAVSYPMTKSGSGKDFFKAYFSDMTAYITRPSATVAKNLGNYSGLLNSATALTRTVTVAPSIVGKREYMTGLYVMPGRTVTLTRTDSNASAVTFGLNMLRDTTHVYNTYDRPTMLASPRQALVKDKPVIITSPFGGPLFLFLGTAAATPDVTVQVSGVTTHPVLRDVNDAAQVAAFQAEIASTPTNWVGITTDFLTVHSNLTNFQSTMTAYGGDLNKLLGNVWTYMIKDTYELAGFNSATPGTFVLPATVSAFCSTAGWDCTGLQHRRDVMQHVISDNYAACGAGCSGNPYDQNWALEPLGWGETHEIGHNLQRTKLKIYAGQSTEVSNNIFPSHKQMAFNKATNPASPIKRGTGSGTGPAGSGAFTLIQASMQSGASATAMFDAVWKDTTYAANNSLRVMFYRQLVEYARTYNTSFTDGWELYTLMYLLERNLTASEATWTTVGATSPTPTTKLVFNTYAAFPTSMDGNDFMLIAASRIIGKDMRPVFDMWGVTYSAAAASQVVAYAYIAADKLLFPMKDVNAYVGGPSGLNVGAPITMTATVAYPSGY